jgi:hypothetical protein
MKISGPNRYDAIDQEQWRTMIESKMFAIYLSRIKDELKRATDTCVHSEVQLDVVRAQGAVCILEAVLYLPERILEEMKAK